MAARGSGLCLRACRKTSWEEEEESRKDVGAALVLRTMSGWVLSTRAGTWPKEREVGDGSRWERASWAESGREESGDLWEGVCSSRRPEIGDRRFREA